MFRQKKTRVVDTRRSYSEFLGFKIRLHKKGKKYVVQSHMCDKAYRKVKANLTKAGREHQISKKKTVERPEKYGCLTQWLWESRIIIS